MRFWLVISEAFKGLVRNWVMTVSVVLVSFVSLLFVGAGALAQIQVSEMKNQWYSKVEVTVSMCASSDEGKTCKGKKATDGQIAEVRKRLESGELAKLIQKVTFVDQNQAYKEFQEIAEGTPLSEATTPDMLPVSFRVKLHDPQKYQVIADELAGQEGVQSVQDQRKVVEPLFNLLNKATLLSWALAGIMLVAAILLIATTIRVAALLRQKRTQIMRLVGASNLFIQLPFILEGALATLIGAVLATGGLALGVHFVQGWVKESFRFIKLIEVSNVLWLSPWLVVTALVVTIVASVGSLAKYTKL
ncbi:MAG: permease-like cell division protein FtsX [Actinomycetaceae bacterium]|nr:permease-like cell division protein FtsX [Actinomycetaceae bacterium]